MTQFAKPPRLLAPALLLAFVAVSSVAIPAQAAPHVISIAQARALPLGTVVTVDGTATTPSGAFDSSFFDKGFGLQDFSAGIYVSLQTNLDVAPGRLARVTGTLQGQLRACSSWSPPVRRTSSSTARAPRSAAMDQHRRRRRVTEGRIVRVFGTITQAPARDLPYGLQVLRQRRLGRAHDLRQHPDRDRPEQLGVGQIVSVTGFSSQFDTHYEIDPRFPADILVLSH